MGRKNAEKWVFILKDATLSFRESQIKKFTEMWNNGDSIKTIAHKLGVKPYEVGLLVMDSELEGRIQPRKGGLLG